MAAKIDLAEATRIVRSLTDAIHQKVFGQEALVEETVACFLAGGHVLMTGAPGLAKTTLVRVIAQNLGLHFGRIQFTPDLLPSDIIGSQILHMDNHTGERHFTFSKGPIFANLLLADEINRASPRTQSALLEAMQERTCTVAGEVHPLDEPFMVLATQNPFESEGTFPLPEAQLDRFLVHTLVEYPGSEAEKKMLEAHAQGQLAGEIQGLTPTEGASIDKPTVLALMDRVKQTTVSPEILEAILELVRSSRPDDLSCPSNLKDMLWYGAGPRAGISLVSLAKSFALMDGSEEVRWRHVKRIAKPALRHRIRLSAMARRDQLQEDQVIATLMEKLEEQHKLLAKGLG